MGVKGCGLMVCKEKSDALKWVSDARVVLEDGSTSKAKSFADSESKDGMLYEMHHSCNKTLDWRCTESLSDYLSKRNIMEYVRLDATFFLLIRAKNECFISFKGWIDGEASLDPGDGGGWRWKVEYRRAIYRKIN
uniref:Uncharacterized protein n=1 Tax=Lactuca sativa TaxID=4236 RepID=A0A9R1X923_LACSA|nr:hypothetical protein LSAT_V11C500275090 [Lactuca sativa]